MEEPSADNEQKKTLGLADTLYLRTGVPETQGGVLATRIILRVLIETLLQMNVITTQQVEDIVTRATEDIDKALEFTPSGQESQVELKFHADATVQLREGAEAVVEKFRRLIPSDADVK